MTKDSSHDPVFLFETSDPKIVSISVSKSGKEKIGDDTAGTLEDLVDNIDQSLRNAGYIYDIRLDIGEAVIDITPFEGIESFNQEVFDIIAEELQFTDNLLTDEEDEEDSDDEAEE